VLQRYTATPVFPRIHSSFLNKKHGLGHGLVELSAATGVSFTLRISRRHSTSRSNLRSMDGKKSFTKGSNSACN